MCAVVANAFDANVVVVIVVVVVVVVGFMLYMIIMVVVAIMVGRWPSNGKTSPSFY